MGQLDMLKAKQDEAVDARKKTEHDIETVRLVRNSGKSFHIFKFTPRIQRSRLIDGV